MQYFTVRYQTVISHVTMPNGYRRLTTQERYGLQKIAAIVDRSWLYNHHFLFVFDNQFMCNKHHSEVIGLRNFSIVHYGEMSVSAATSALDRKWCRHSIPWSQINR